MPLYSTSIDLSERPPSSKRHAPRHGCLHRRNAPSNFICQAALIFSFVCSAVAFRVSCANPVHRHRGLDLLVRAYLGTAIENGSSGEPWWWACEGYCTSLAFDTHRIVVAGSGAWGLYFCEARGRKALLGSLQSSQLCFSYTKVYSYC